MQDVNPQARRIVLASLSPRRREIIGALQAEVTFVDSDYREEAHGGGETPEAYVTRLSSGKARHAVNPLGNAVVIGADTSVVLDGQVLGKPIDACDAKRMLKQLRGRTHTVLTGVSVYDETSGKLRSRVKATKVVIRDLSDREIEAYVASGETMDKAGGYAVQDTTFRPAERVDGCYLNAVGFPLCDVVALLKECGINVSVNSNCEYSEQCTDCPVKIDGEMIAS